MIRSAHAGRFELVLIASLAATGCGNNVATVPVSGSVVFRDGTSPQFGSVELESDDRQFTAKGKIERDGSFVLSTFQNGDGAVVGKHRAIVMQLVISDGVSKTQHHHGHTVHPKHAKYETSGLQAEVAPDGPNRLTLAVEAAPSR